jgi:hypothetical protein
MNRALIFLFLAGTLTMTPTAQRVVAAQSNPQTTDNPQPQATNQAPSHGRHHTRHSSNAGKRRHHHHKTSAKH